MSYLPILCQSFPVCASLEISFPFTYILPLSLCVCSFRMKSCPSVKETEASGFLTGRHCLRHRWKLALSYWPGLQCSRCSSLPRRLSMILAWACFPSELATTEVSRQFDPHHGIKGKCSFWCPWMCSLLGCKMPGGGVQGTRYKAHPLRCYGWKLEWSCIWLTSWEDRKRKSNMKPALLKAIAYFWAL